jgi:uncharacterized membrane protein
MKSLNLILIYIVSFMVLFFVFSAIGLLWEHSYAAIISNENWFIVYGMALGSWLSIFPAVEYYSSNEEYFDRVFG